MDTRGHTLSVDGVDLHWVERGITSAPSRIPLVLLHGLHDCHLTWKQIAPLLARERRVLMPDLAGCGRSSRPNASYTLEWHARLIARWLRRLDIGTVDLVGHSFGGGVAQMMLLERAVRVRRLGLAAAGGIGRRVSAWLRLCALPRVVEHFGQPFMGVGTRLALRHTRARMSAEDAAALSLMNTQEGSARAFARTLTDVVSYRGQRRSFLDDAHRTCRLPAIRLLWGEDDNVTPIRDAEDFVRGVEGVELVRFDGCGHYVHHERAEEVAQALDAFLDAPVVERARVRATSVPAVDPPLLAWATAYAAVLEAATKRPSRVCANVRFTATSS